jgi:hypothetical protein
MITVVLVRIYPDPNRRIYSYIYKFIFIHVKNLFLYVSVNLLGLKFEFRTYLHKSILLD